MSFRFQGRLAQVAKKLFQPFGKGRDVYRVARRLLRDRSLVELLCRCLHIVQREGVQGIWARVRFLHSRLLPTTFSVVATTSGETFSTLPATAIACRADGRYELSTVPAGYTYVPPRAPANLDERLATLAPRIRFSIVTPVYNTRPEWLADLLASVRGQWYPDWELILIDDASPDPETQSALAGIDDVRVRLLRLSINQGIAGATNAGLDAAQGDFVVFLDHDDELTPDCLYELALCIDREQPDYLYSDEDKRASSGKFIEPHFKPAWSPDTMMSTMYTCHVSCVRRSLLAATGGLRPEVNGCQDWDLALRVSEHTRRISHIPKVLYHWRILPASIASDIAAKPYVLEASRRVREAALVRRQLAGKVEALPRMPGYFRINYALRGKPLISIVIPSRDNAAVLRRCLDSIFTLSSYRRFELVILDNGSVQAGTLAYLAELGARPAVTVIRHDAPFNYSELNNLGVRHANGELLLFLNDDTEVLQADWLQRLGGYAQLSHVGAVGAKLLYPGGRLVQHAGILNLEDGPGHAFLRQEADSPGYFMRNQLEYNWLAVTGACLMVERCKFEQIGGFAECLAVAYNDIDLCMRLSDAGYYNLVVQAVRLIHHESLSRGVDHIDPAKRSRLQGEAKLMYQRNPRYFQYDPFHSINLHPNGINFEVPV